jgi:hypothetical protein
VDAPTGNTGAYVHPPGNSQADVEGVTVSVSIRAVLVPGVALATVGAVALAPTLVAPNAAAPAQTPVAIPAVYIADIQLAGIGRDIYNSVSAVVQGLAQWAEWVVGIIPFVGSAIAAQINLNYADLIQPLIANTVYALSDIIANPLGLLTTAGSYVSNQIYTGYTWVASQIRFFGLPPILGPIPAPPPLASSGRKAARPAAARLAAPRAAAAVSAAHDDTAPDVAATVSARASRVGAGRAGRTVAVDGPTAHTPARAAAARSARPAAAASRTLARAVANTAG